MLYQCANNTVLQHVVIEVTVKFINELIHPKSALKNSLVLMTHQKGSLKTFLF